MINRKLRAELNKRNIVYNCFTCKHGMLGVRPICLDCCAYSNYEPLPEGFFDEQKEIVRQFNEAMKEIGNF